MIKGLHEKPISCGALIAKSPGYAFEIILMQCP